MIRILRRDDHRLLAGYAALSLVGIACGALAFLHVLLFAALGADGIHAVQGQPEFFGARMHDTADAFEQELLAEVAAIAHVEHPVRAAFTVHWRPVRAAR